MRRVWSIVCYEFKMQIRRRAAWGLLLAVLSISLSDSFPSAGNLARLEFLSVPDYFIYRTIGVYGLIMAMGLMFLVSNRIPADEKAGVKPLMMAAPVRKWQYITGKLTAAAVFSFTMLSVFLLLNQFIYFIAVPVKPAVPEMLLCFCRAEIVSIVPISIFVGFSAASFPALTDIRLFYLLAGLLFVFNASCVNHAEGSPFYLITSGNLLRCIWVHPKYPQIDYAGVWANLLFLLAGGFGSWALLTAKRRFWRSE